MDIKKSSIAGWGKEVKNPQRNKSGHTTKSRERVGPGD